MFANLSAKSGSVASKAMFASSWLSCKSPFWSDLMIERGECFFVLKTKSWSIDSEEELNDLLTKIKSGLTQIS